MHHFVKIRSGISRLFQDKDYEHILGQFSRRLGQIRTLSELAEHIAGTVEQALHPASVALLLRKGNVLTLRFSRPALPPGEHYALDCALATRLAAKRQPVYLPAEAGWLSSLDEAERRTIEHDGASLYIPFFTGDQLAGWLALGPSQAPRAYSPDDLDFLVTLSAQVGVVLENVRLVDELEQRVDQLAVLSETGQALGASLRVEELLENIRRQVGRLMDASNLYVAFYDPETDTVSFPLALENDQRQERPNRQAGHGLTEYVIRGRRPLLIGREVNKRLAQLGIQAMGRPAQSWMGVPMIANGQVIGVVAVQNYEREQVYTEDDVGILGTIAAQAAIAIANARLYEQTDQALAQRVNELAVRNRQLGEILKFGNALKANVDLDRILEQVVQAVYGPLGFNVAIVNLVQRAPAPHLQRAAAAGIPPEAWEYMRTAEISLDVLPQLMRDEFRISQSFFIRHAHADRAGRLTFHSPQARHAADEGDNKWHPGDVLLVPLTDTSGALVGMLSVEEPADQRLPTHETIETLEVFANQASIAIENARLFRERARRINDLSKLYQASLALTFSTETRDALGYIANLARELAASDSVSIFLYNSQTDALTPAIAVGDHLPDQRAFMRPSGLTRRAIVERCHFVVADTVQNPHVNQQVLEAGIRALVCMPLISKGEVLGVMYANSVTPNKYLEDDIQVLSALASQAAVAVETGQLFRHLAEGRDRLQAVLDSTREGIMMLDNTGRIVFTNAMFGELFNTSPSDLTGRRLLDVVAENIVPPDEIMSAMMDVIYETLSELADHNEAVHKSSVTVAHPARFYERVSAPVFNKAGVSLGRLLALRDITEEKKAEALREDLTRMIVHDLRSPLSSVLGSLQVLELGLVDDYHLRAVQIALSGSKRLLDLINALLDISKMEAGQMPLRRQLMRWAHIVHESVEHFKALAASEGVTLQTQVANDVPSIYADEEILQRVVINLLDNAIKFSPAGSTVTLSVMALENAGKVLGTICRVTDAGAGIPPEYHEQIFTKFFQVPNHAGRRRGSGLGLAFCRLAIEAHGGRIWVESVEGKGSTFTFTLPVGDQADPS